MQKTFQGFTGKRIIRKMYGGHCLTMGYGIVRGHYVDIKNRTYSVIAGKSAVQVEGAGIKRFVRI